MRLLQLALYTNAHAGSFLPMAFSILSEAQVRGWRSEAVFPEASQQHTWTEQFVDHGIDIRFAPPGNRRALAAWIEGLLAEDEGPTVLHTHFTGYDVAARLAARGRDRTPVFWHVHTTLDRGPQAVLRNAVKFGVLGRGVEGIFCPSDDIADDVARRLGPREKIQVVPSAIDLERFPMTTDAERRQARQELSLPQEGRVLLHFGWNWPIKGGDLFVETLDLLRREWDPAIIGVTSQGGQIARDAGAKLGLGDQLRVLQPIERVQTLFAAADAVVAPSRGEGMPFAVVEAICCGVPVIASDLAGHRFVAEEVEACRIAPRDPREMASTVREVLERTPEVADRQALQGRDWVARNLGLPALAERLMATYESALSA